MTKREIRKRIPYSVAELRDRYTVLCMGLFFMALGISLSIRAALGITPISCPPYVLSLHPGWLTVGQFTMIMHLLFVAIQVAIRGRDFPKAQYMQAVMGFVFGFFIDAANWFTSLFIPDVLPYWARIALVLAGSVSVGAGVVMEVTARAMLIAGEGLMLCLSRLWGIPFGRVKVGFDCTLLTLSVVISLLLFGEVRGVREGTVISAVLVGVIAGRLQPVLGVRLAHWLDRHEVRRHINHPLSGV